MPKEIEHKYRVNRAKWREAALDPLKVLDITQGYLAQSDEAVVRVRLIDQAAQGAGCIGRLTIKERKAGLSRLEIEEPISKGKARKLLSLCGTRIVSKRRYVVSYAQHTWEVDEFSGDNAGLMLAEIEVSSEDYTDFEVPPWAVEEVTADERYYNASLAEHPISVVRL
jgi:CYTH domain-containing protein